MHRNGSIFTSVSVALISCKGIENLTIYQHFGRFLAIFLLHMCRNGCNGASGENPDITI